MVRHGGQLIDTGLVIAIGEVSSSIQKFCIVGNENDEGQCCAAVERGRPDISENPRRAASFYQFLTVARYFPLLPAISRVHSFTMYPGPISCLSGAGRATLTFDRGEHPSARSGQGRNAVSGPQCQEA